MDIKSKITSTAILALAITGCTIGDTPQSNQPTNTPQTPAKTGTKIAIQPATTPKTTSETTPSQPFAPKTPGLIEYTKPDVRADLINKGRPNPFGEIISTPPTVNSTNVAKRIVPVLPAFPPTQPVPNNTQQVRQPQPPPQVRQPQPPQQARQPQPPRSANVNKPIKQPVAAVPKAPPKPPVAKVLPKVLPQVVTPTKIEPIAPPPPEPTNAQAVLVSGVILIGEQPKAIIKVPDEPSRYVQAGQRLANGVLVKRIEMNGGTNPIVVFEELGIEVARAVGEKPNPEKSKTTAAVDSLESGTPL